MNLWLTGGCQSDQFECQSGMCIRSDWECDAIVDCPGGDDEQGCGKQLFMRFMFANLKAIKQFQ